MSLPFPSCHTYSNVPLQTWASVSPTCTESITIAKSTYLQCRTAGKEKKLLEYTNTILFGSLHVLQIRIQ